MPSLTVKSPVAKGLDCILFIVLCASLCGLALAVFGGISLENDHLLAPYLMGTGVLVGVLRSFLWPDAYMHGNLNASLVLGGIGVLLYHFMPYPTEGLTLFLQVAIRLLWILSAGGGFLLENYL